MGAARWLRRRGFWVEARMVEEEVVVSACWTEQFANCAEMIREVVIIRVIRRFGGVTKRLAECGTKSFF